MMSRLIIMQRVPSALLPSSSSSILMMTCSTDLMKSVRLGLVNAGMLSDEHQPEIDHDLMDD